LHCRIYSFLFIIFLLLSAGTIQAGTDLSGELYFPGRAFFKVASEYKVDLPLKGSGTFGVEHIDQFLQQIDVERLERTFPDCDEPISGKTDLTRIYTLYFHESLPVVVAVWSGVQRECRREYTLPGFRGNDNHQGTQPNNVKRILNAYVFFQYYELV